VLGASFDTPEENLAFATAEHFGFPLLCDPDMEVGRAYEVVRSPDDERANLPLRIAYLIDPEGIITRSYDVTDVNGFADAVLADLEALEAD
jgi:thioredoxin-dependent peroxiredoxin